MVAIANIVSQWNLCLANGVKSKYKEKLRDTETWNWWESVGSGQ